MKYPTQVSTALVQKFFTFKILHFQIQRETQRQDDLEATEKRRILVQQNTVQAKISPK